MGSSARGPDVVDRPLTSIARSYRSAFDHTASAQMVGRSGMSTIPHRSSGMQAPTPSPRADEAADVGGLQTAASDRAARLLQPRAAEGLPGQVWRARPRCGGWQRTRARAGGHRAGHAGARLPTGKQASSSGEMVVSCSRTTRLAPLRSGSPQTNKQTVPAPPAAALPQGCAMDLAPVQASTLLSLAWRTHRASVEQRLTIERSFQLFRWGVERPAVAAAAERLPGAPCHARIPVGRGHPLSAVRACYQMPQIEPARAGAKDSMMCGQTHASRTPHHHHAWRAPASPPDHGRPRLLPYRDSLLAHSLHRPPFSAGVFTAQQAPQLLAWALSAYYRHYKLYQYAFTARVTLELSSHAAGAGVEAPAQPAALQEALGPDEYQALLAERERQVRGAARRASEAAAAARNCAASSRCWRHEHRRSGPGAPPVRRRQTSSAGRWRRSRRPGLQQRRALLHRWRMSARPPPWLQSTRQRCLRRWRAKWGRWVPLLAGW
jgi:hypothetical protein